MLKAIEARIENFYNTYSSPQIRRMYYTFLSFENTYILSIFGKKKFNNSLFFSDRNLNHRSSISYNSTKSSNNGIGQLVGWIKIEASIHN